MNIKLRFPILILALLLGILPLASSASAIFAFEAPSYDVYVGKTEKVKPVAQGIDGKLTYAWSSSDEKVATVKDGTVKGISADPLYAKHDMVYFNGGSYAYTNDTPSNELPTSTTHWQQIATMGGQELVDAAVAARDVAQAQAVLAQGYTAQLAAGIASPAGTYADLTALIAADPDHSKIYITLDDGKWCYWNGSEFVAGGVYQATGIGDGTITPIKTNFFEYSTNLVDESDLTVGYVSLHYGTITSDAAWRTSPFIKINPATSYMVRHYRELAYYDSSKTFISGLTGSYFDVALDVPATAEYVRFSITLSSSIDPDIRFHMNEGSVVLPYEPFWNRIPYENLDISGHDISVNDIPDGALSVRKMSFITQGKNLFNPYTATAGYVVNEGDGTIYANGYYHASDYIDVTPETQYSQSYGAYTAFYDADKNFISGLGATEDRAQRIITTPESCYYTRMSCSIEDLPLFQIEKGASATSYEPYSLTLEKGIVLDEKDSVSVFLPEEICVAVGRTIEIYNVQVVNCGNIKNYHISWSCPTAGKAMKRKFSITGSVAYIGNHTLTLTVYNNNMIPVATASTTIKVVTNIVTPHSILTIGDSLTNEKKWLAELRLLSGNQYTMVGTRGTAPLKHEGRSGFSAATYLTNKAYSYESEGVHPFWNDSVGAERFDWSYYKSTHSINPDAVQLFLGTNGMALDPTANAAAIQAIVDYIRADDAIIPIFVVYTLYRGNQDGIGNEVPVDGYSYEPSAWSLRENRKVFNLMVKLNTLLKEYTNLHFVPIATCHDSEYNFGAVETPVNPRAAQMEYLPSQATHPQEQGYLQMADIMFSVMAAHL